MPQPLSTTILFERSALIAVVGLVAGLVMPVFINPLERATAVNKVSLRLAVSQLIPAPVVPKTTVTAAKTVNPAPEKAAVAGIDTLTGAVSVRAVKRPLKLPPLKTVEVLSVTFQQLGYDLERVRTGEVGVPRLFLAALPGDIKDIRESRVRKTLFFKTVLPLVLQANEEILRDRRRLWKLHLRLSSNQKLRAEDRLWLMMISERYGVKQGDVTSLLKRVDIIPPSLALAQAALESGWGTSRFVREGNAVFGQWTFSKAGNLAPARRDKDKLHNIRAFSNLLDSVRAYARNLNTHRAYRQFRRARYDFRLRGAPLDSLLLVENLKNYSQRGQEYVGTIRVLIESNKLRRLDDARLREAILTLPWPHLIVPGPSPKGLFTFQIDSI